MIIFKSGDLNDLENKIREKIERKIENEKELIKCHCDAELKKVVNKFFSSDSLEESKYVRKYLSQGYCEYEPIEVDTLRGEFIKQMTVKCEEKAKEIYLAKFSEQVKSFLNGEDFIDLVVNRINKKQVNK